MTDTTEPQAPFPLSEEIELIREIAEGLPLCHKAYGRLIRQGWTPERIAAQVSRMRDYVPPLTRQLLDLGGKIAEVDKTIEALKIAFGNAGRIDDLYFSNGFKILRDHREKLRGRMFRIAAGEGSLL